MSAEINSSVHLLQGLKPEKSKKSSEASHQTYRLLKRKNLIVEAVQNLKIIEGLFPSVNLKYSNLFKFFFFSSRGEKVNKHQRAVFLQAAEDDPR